MQDKNKFFCSSPTSTCLDVESSVPQSPQVAKLNESLV